MRDRKRSFVRVAAYCAALALMLAPPVWPRDEAQRMLEHYTQGMAAKRKQDFAASRDHFEEAVRHAPGHLDALYNLARARALTGQREEAIKLLQRILRMGRRMDIDTNPDFVSLRGMPEWQSLRSDFKRLKEPVGLARRSFTIEETTLIPEGIAYDRRDDAFFVGSLYKRKILRIDRNGKVSDFQKSGENGLWDVLGMKVDAKRRHLWVATSAGPGAGEENGSAAVFKYELPSGRLLKKYALSNQPRHHLLNDLVVAPNGDVYVTDTQLKGAVYVICHDRDQLEPLGKAGDYVYPNGIAISGDGKILFVADWLYGISMIDLRSGAHRPLAAPEDVSLSEIDGLYYHDNSLVAIQNVNEPHRVVRFCLNNARDRVTRAAVLAASHPLFAIPTTGVIVGETFYFIANSHVDKYQNGQLAPLDPAPETIIMQLSL